MRPRKVAMPEWGTMVDPEQLIRELLDLKLKLEDFAKRMERVEDALFEGNKSPLAHCGYPGCPGHNLCL